MYTVVLEEELFIVLLSSVTALFHFEKCECW